MNVTFVGAAVLLLFTGNGVGEPRVQWVRGNRRMVGNRVQLSGQTPCEQRAAHTSMNALFIFVARAPSVYD